MVKGWRDTPIFARSEWWNGQKHPVTLPDPVCELIDLIEHFTGTTVISIGNGPRADEIIYIQRVGGGGSQGAVSGKGAAPSAQQRKSPPKSKK